MIAVMLRPRWVLALVFALAVAAGFAFLGQWQFGRAIATGEVVERPTEQILPLDEIARPGGAMMQSANGQMVAVTGRYVAGDEQVVSGRLNSGVRGHWVVSHLLTEGSTSIPVARGWTAERTDAESVARRLGGDTGTGADTTTVTGRLQPGEAPVVPPEGSDPHRMTTVSVAALINLWSEVPGPVYAGYVVATDAPAGLENIDSPAPEDEFAVNWLNIFYAVEWVVFAGFAVFLWYRLVRDAFERERDLAAESPGATEGATSAPRGT